MKNENISDFDNQSLPENKPPQFHFPNVVLDQAHQKILQIPLEFEYQPVQIISKELTKLNSSYSQRIIFLGPRWSHSVAIHKKYSHHSNQTHNKNYNISHPEEILRYPFQFQKVARSSMFMDSFQKNQYYKTAIYYRAFEGMNPTLAPEESEIKFDASFESSNLDCVIRVKDKQYDLFLRIDSNTRGHTQWYYFLVKNGPNKCKIQLNICNLMKSQTLYQKNMKPYVFSKKKNKKFGVDWQQNGINVQFQTKKLRYQFVYQKIKVRSLSRLSFQYQFQFPEDEVYFAYCVPYTYSQLLREISQLQRFDQSNQEILEVCNHSYSLMGLPIPILQITDPKIPQHNKKIVLATARIHPGESNGSIVMSGFMKYLCSSQASQLRKKVIFLIIPMLNPDGVILGNYRTSAIGKDMNRQYYNSHEQLFPELMMIKKLVENLKKTRDIHMFLDFHGHSQKKNTFVYGPGFTISDAQYYKSKILPKLISLKTEMFRYYSCIFRISEVKKSTGRALMFEQYHIPYTYTIQSSNGFYYDADKMNTFEFNKKKWNEMGKCFGIGLSEYFNLIEQYQQLINHRKMMKTKQKSRIKISQQKKKSEIYRSRRISKQFSDEVATNQEFKVDQTPPQKLFLLSVLDQIKNQNFQKKMIEDDIQQDSDSWNSEDDLEPLKMAQFSKIIIKDSIKRFEFFPTKKILAFQESCIKTQQKFLSHKKILRNKNSEIKNIQSQIFNELLQKPKSNTQKRRENNLEKKNKNQKNIDERQFLILSHLKQKQHYHKKIPIHKSINEEIQCVQTTYRPKKQIKKNNQINQNTVMTHTHNFLTDVIFANHESQGFNTGKYTRNSVFNNKIVKVKKFERNRSEKKKEDNSVEETVPMMNINKILGTQQIHQQSSQTKVNYTKLLYMINSKTVDLKKDLNQLPIGSKNCSPTAFYRIKNHIKSKKNGSQKQEHIDMKSSENNNQYLQIKKFT